MYCLAFFVFFFALQCKANECIQNGFKSILNEVNFPVTAQYTWAKKVFLFKVIGLTDSYSVTHAGKDTLNEEKITKAIWERICTNEMFTKLQPIGESEYFKSPPCCCVTLFGQYEKPCMDVLSLINKAERVSLNDLLKVNVGKNHVGVKGKVNEKIWHCYDYAQSYRLQNVDIKQWKKALVSFNAKLAAVVPLTMNHMEIAHELSNEVKALYDLPFSIFKKPDYVLKDIMKLDIESTDEIIRLKAEGSYGVYRKIQFYPRWYLKKTEPTAKNVMRYFQPHKLDNAKFCILTNCNANVDIKMSMLSYRLLEHKKFRQMNNCVRNAISDEESNNFRIFYTNGPAGLGALFVGGNVKRIKQTPLQYPSETN